MGAPARLSSFICPASAKSASARWSARSWCASARTCSPARRPPASTCWIPTPYFKLGRKVAYFGDGYQFRDTRYGRSVWVVPILSGEFVIDRRFGYRDGLMGGNLWLFGKDVDSALAAAERCTGAIARTPGVITPFPGGVVGSGSKPGSRYSFAIASTHEQFCPTLRGTPGLESRLPHDVHAVMEIIIDGRDILSIIAATQAAIAAAVDTPGLVKISAGNYGGKLGKSLIYLHPDKQPVQ